MLLSLVFEHFIFFLSTPKKKKTDNRDNRRSCCISTQQKNRKMCVISFKNRILFLFFFLGLSAPKVLPTTDMVRKNAQSLTAHSTSCFEKEEDFLDFLIFSFYDLTALVPPYRDDRARAVFVSFLSLSLYIIKKNVQRSLTFCRLCVCAGLQLVIPRDCDVIKVNKTHTHTHSRSSIVDTFLSLLSSRLSVSLSLFYVTFCRDVTTLFVDAKKKKKKTEILHHRKI